MTPHGIIEGMALIERACGDRFDEFFARDMWGVAKAMLRDATDFQFGAATPETAHIEFANDLMDKQLFRLPFDSVLYRANALPHTAILAVAGSGDPYRLMLITFAPIKSREGIDAAGPLLLLALKGETVADMRIDWKSLTTMPHASRTTGRQWGDADYQIATEKALNFVLGATVLLMSKDVDVATVPAPTKLNKARERKGRPPIRDSRVVKIRPHALDAQRRALAEFGSERASPRIHWRRGHFRKIRTDFVVPIAPTVVGVRGDIDLRPKPYEVKL